MKQINIVLFDGFTTLDALGPAEVFSKLDRIYCINYYSVNGGLITSSTHNKIQTDRIDEIAQKDIVLIPGGWGARQLVNDENFIEKIKAVATESENVLSVCTGSAILAKTGLLDDREATSNKMSWEWVISQNKKVRWLKKARWTVDGKYYTSSGITAGIDMSLGFIKDKVNYEAAKMISKALEYLWNENKDVDPFAG